MSFSVTDSVKQAPPNMNGVMPSLRAAPSGMLGGSNGYVQHGMPPPAMLDSSRDSFAQPTGLPSTKPPPSFRPPFRSDLPPSAGGRFSEDPAMQPRSQPPPPPGDWSPVNSGRGYNGLPTPSFLGMDEPAGMHSQPPPPQQPSQHVYPNAYGHFDSGSYPTPPSSVPSMRPEPDRGFMPHPNLYSNMDHPQGGGEHYGLLDPSGQSFDARSGMPRSAYGHPGAPVLRPDQRPGMPFGADARYMGPQPVRKAIPDPPGFFEGASSMVPALPMAQKRPKARIDSAARKRICQFAEVNPEMRQADVAAAFNVERSTVSKILKQKAKWLAYQPDDASDEGKTAGAPGGIGGTPSGAAALKASAARITKGPTAAATAAHSRRQSSTTARSRAPSVLPSPQANTRSPLPGMPTPELAGLPPGAGPRPGPGQPIPSGMPFLPRPSQYPPQHM